ncbi:MAG: hypothetical protein QXF29_00665 [Archaeoglobaceae archaeon]
MGFFIGENLLKRLGIEDRKRKPEIKLKDLQDYLRNRFLVNSALIYEGRKKLIGVDEVEVKRMEEMLENLKSDEIIIFNGKDCRFALRKGNVFIYVRGKIASLRDFVEIWEVVHGSMR